MCEYVTVGSDCVFMPNDCGDMLQPLWKLLFYSPWQENEIAISRSNLTQLKTITWPLDIILVVEKYFYIESLFIAVVDDVVVVV